MRRQDRFRQLGDDLRLRQQVLARRLDLSVRGMEASGGVLDGHELRARRLPVDLDAAEARQQIGGLAMDHRAAVELRDDLHCEPEMPPGALHDFGFGDGADEVAAERRRTL